MSNRWFRFYAEALEDPKVQGLPPKFFKLWVNILCLACKTGGELPSVNNISFSIRLSKTETKLTLSFLKARGLLDLKDGTTDCFIPHSWNNRQYKSDVSNDRVRRYRKRKCNVTVTGNVTPPETDTDTDADKKESKRRGSRFALDSPPGQWIQFCQTQRPDLNPGLTFDKFNNHWKAKPGKDGRKLDWFKTWQNWVYSEKSNQGANYGKPTKIDLIAQGIAEARAKREQRESGQVG